MIRLDSHMAWWFKCRSLLNEKKYKWLTYFFLIEFQSSLLFLPLPVTQSHTARARDSQMECFGLQTAVQRTKSRIFYCEWLQSGYSWKHLKWSSSMKPYGKRCMRDVMQNTKRIQLLSCRMENQSPHSTLIN